MERKLNIKANKYFTDFKDNIAQIINDTSLNNDVKNSIIQTIYEYKRFEITKQDLQKENVLKIVPLRKM